MCVCVCLDACVCVWVCVFVCMCVCICVDGIQPPPLLPVPACRALGAHAALWVASRRLRGSGFPPSLHAVRWERMLLGGCPLPVLLSWGDPLLPLRHAVRWEHTLPYGRSPPSSGRSPCAVGVHSPSPIPSSTWIWGFPSSCLGMPCAGSAHCRTGGSPPSSGLGPRAVGVRGPSLTPSCLRAVCTRCWGGGAPSYSWDLSPGGVP